MKFENNRSVYILAILLIISHSGPQHPIGPSPKYGSDFKTTIALVHTPYFSHNNIIFIVILIVSSETDLYIKSNYQLKNIFN